MKRTFSAPHAQGAGERNRAAMEDLIIAGCLPERQAEARALLERYPVQLADLPGIVTGGARESWVILDPGKLSTPEDAVKVYAHEIAHVSDIQAGRQGAHDLNFAARAEGLTRRLTGSGSADRVYDLHESGMDYDRHVHSIIESRARRIASAAQYDPALGAACDHLDNQLALLRVYLVVIALGGIVLALAWVPGLWAWVRDWWEVVAMAAAFAGLAVVVGWALWSE